jgi:hypothetical protein
VTIDMLGTMPGFFPCCALVRRDRMGSEVAAGSHREQ